MSNINYEHGTLFVSTTMLFCRLSGSEGKTEKRDVTSYAQTPF